MTRPDKIGAVEQWDEYWRAQARTGFISAPDEVWETLTETLDLAGLEVLDLATGTGGTAARLVAGGARVTAVDLSLQSLWLARRAAGQKAEFQAVAANVMQLPFPASAFALVVSLGVMHYFPDPQPFLAELCRMTRHDGWVLVEVPQKFSPFTLHKRRRMAQGRWEYGAWETEYSVEKLKALLAESGFLPVRCYAREYYPYAYYAVRHLAKIESRFGFRLLPARIWRGYDQLWRRLERGWWGLHTLRDVGVLARKTVHQ